MKFLPSNINSFESRSKSVFDSLLSIESNHKVKESEYINQTEELVNQKDFELEQRVQSDSDSEFKIPCIESYKRQLKNASCSVSKHQKKAPVPSFHSDKWTKYSLEDVDASQMSSSANFNAAMSFLNKTNELEKSVEQSSGDIVYNKPIGANKMETNREKNSQVEQYFLEKISEEQEEVQDELEKMELSESGPDKIHFKKKIKSKNIRVSRKSIDDDLEHKEPDQVEQMEELDKKSDNDALDEFDFYDIDNAEEENEFGDDFDRY